jgi:hypothetical protein
VREEEALMPKLSGGGARRRKRLRRTYGVYRAAEGKAVPIGIHVIKARAKRCGSKWFDPRTMRFFNTRLAKKAYPSKSGKCFYFVTSEAFDYKSKRKYSVRRMCSCNVDTVGEFQQYGSQKTATAKAKALAAKDKR